MFTIRVYGICIKRIEGTRKILVMDEVIKGRRITKFPGGGLEYGESTVDCLIREIREELKVEATDLRHFYTTDLFQQSLFHTAPMQVISIYYRFKLARTARLEVLKEAFGFPDPTRQEGCRWMHLDSPVESLSLPIDRHVLALLQRKFPGR